MIIMSFKMCASRHQCTQQSHAFPSRNASVVKCVDFAPSVHLPLSQSMVPKCTIIAEDSNILLFKTASMSSFTPLLPMP